MGFKLCPKCELNYIKDDEEICSVCAGKIGTSRVPLIRTKTEPYIFMVYQGKFFNMEAAGDYIQAPANSSNHHWQRLLDLQKEDIILHAVDGQIIAISTVLKPAYALNGFEAKHPIVNRVDCKYQFLRRPLTLSKYKDEILKYGQNQYSPFNKNGTGNQGYLFVLSHELGKIFIDEIKISSN